MAVRVSPFAWFASSSLLILSAFAFVVAFSSSICNPCVTSLLTTLFCDLMNADARPTSPPAIPIKTDMVFKSMLFDL